MLHTTRVKGIIGFVPELSAAHFNIDHIANDLYPLAVNEAL